MIKVLTPILSIALGLGIAYGIKSHANSQRPLVVMASVESVPGAFIELPQPLPMPDAAAPAPPAPAPQPLPQAKPLVNNQAGCVAQRPWCRRGGPLRATARFFRDRQPVRSFFRNRRPLRSFFGRLFGFRRCW